MIYPRMVFQKGWGGGKRGGGGKGGGFTVGIASRAKESSQLARLLETAQDVEWKEARTGGGPCW